jgi:hypothetical protein
MLVSTVRFQSKDKNMGSFYAGNFWDASDLVGGFSPYPSEK